MKMLVEICVQDFRRLSHWTMTSSLKKMSWVLYFFGLLSGLVQVRLWLSSLEVPGPYQKMTRIPSLNPKLKIR